MAEKRILASQLKAIDNNLKRINETDDLSYADSKDVKQHEFSVTGEGSS